MIQCLFQIKMSYQNQLEYYELKRTSKVEVLFYIGLFLLLSCPNQFNYKLRLLDYFKPTLIWMILI